MKMRSTKFSNGVKKACATLLVLSFVFGMFSMLTLTGSADTQAEEVFAVRVKDLPSVNPYFVQELYLEPNTDYVFTYLYSGAPASATVAFKGSNEKRFDGQVTVHECEEYYRVSLTFRTTDGTDSDATMGTGDNEGKIKAYVGIRNYSTNTAVLNTYFADFKLYKKSDANAENVLRDIQFNSIGSTSSGSTWNAFPAAFWNNNYYEKATVSKDIFQNPTPNHNMVKTEAKPATCEEDGNIEYYTCSKCGKKYNDAAGTRELTEAEIIVKATGHSYGTDWKSDADNHWHECTCGDRAEIAPHTFGDWTITKEATEIEKGSKEKTCTVCGYKVTEVIPVVENDKDTNNPDKESDFPQTGDSSKSTPLIALLFVSGSCLAVCAVANRRKKHNR